MVYDQSKWKLSIEVVEVLHTGVCAPQSRRTLPQGASEQRCRGHVPHSVRLSHGVPGDTMTRNASLRPFYQLLGHFDDTSIVRAQHRAY